MSSPRGKAVINRGDRHKEHNEHQGYQNGDERTYQLSQGRRMVSLRCRRLSAIFAAQ